MRLKPPFAAYHRILYCFTYINIAWIISRNILETNLSFVALVNNLLVRKVSVELQLQINTFSVGKYQNTWPSLGLGMGMSLPHPSQ